MVFIQKTVYNIVYKNYKVDFSNKFVYNIFSYLNKVRVKMPKKNTFSEGPWFVYIILCEGGSLYTGIAKDIEKRFKLHLSGRGAKYTKIHRPLSIVHKEEYSDHSSAIKREIQIKSYPVKQKRSLVDLS